MYINWPNIPSDFVKSGCLKKFKQTLNTTFAKIHLNVLELEDVHKSKINLF